MIHAATTHQLTAAALCGLIAAAGPVGHGLRAQGMYEEFRFHSEPARVLLQQVRKAHGLTTPRPLALLGTVVRGEVTDRVVVVVDATGKYKRGGATIQGTGSASRLTGSVTHFLDGDSYRKIPVASAEVAAVARPRLESEFTMMSVTMLLRPPRGRRMTVRAEPPAEFNGEEMNRLDVALGEQAVCTLFIRKRDATVAGWSTLAETGAGMMPRIVIVESAKLIDGIRVPVILRERTGDKYASLTRYTKILTGQAALTEFTREEIGK